VNFEGGRRSTSQAADWFVCTRCGMGYADTLRRPGMACHDLSWVPNGVFAIDHTLRAHRRLMCRGRVWPHAANRSRWSRNQLAGWQRSQIELVLHG